MIEKICSTCKLYYPISNFHRSAKTSDQLAYICKSCASIKRKINYKKNKVKEQIAIKKWQENNKERIRTNYLKRYGITQYDYDNMRLGQNFSCAICKRHEETIPKGTANNSTTCLAVDHCHTTGKVRGLLCWNCNAMLGKCRDKISILYSAIDYLSSKQELKERKNLGSNHSG